MALVVTHNSTADGDPLIDGDDWNANHTLTGGGTFRIPKHIETKTLAAGSTTTTFSSLNGDVDGIYLLKFNILLTATGVDRTLNLNINGSSSNMGSTRLLGTDSGVGYTSTSSIILGANGWAKDGPIWGECNIHATSGVIRPINGGWNHFATDKSHAMVQSYTGYWDNTTDNITSLTCVISGGSFSGWFKLYKMVDLTI